MRSDKGKKRSRVLMCSFSQEHDKEEGKDLNYLILGAQAFLLELKKTHYNTGDPYQKAKL